MNRALLIPAISLILPALATIAFAQDPKIVSVEAYPGEPFGIGKVVFRIPESDRMIAETGALQISDRDNRVFYPVSAGGFMGRILGGGEPTPDLRNTIWFLFRGDQTLHLTIQSAGSTDVKVDPFTPRRRIFVNQCWRAWWREYNKAFQNNDDYPLAFEIYLTSMLAERLGTAPTARTLRKQNPNQMKKTLDLMFGVESVRARTIQEIMHSGVAPAAADQALPADCQWEPVPVAAPQAIPKIETIATCIPQECFYVRFGNWGNQVWLKQLMAEYGGDMSRMIQLRGFEFPGAADMMKQLVLESSELDDLLGGNVVADVAFVGTDFYVNDGATIGVVFESKSALFKRSLIGKRKALAKKEENVELEEIKIGEAEATFLRSPDNQVRSILVSHDNIHLVTNSLRLAERFIEAAKGTRRLSDHPEFQHARLIYPLEREDTIFAYFSADFFHQLLSPQYQVELRRRSSLMAEVQLFQMAAMIAKKEGLREDDVEQWVENGLLPEDFGFRADGSTVTYRDGTYFDSIRGRRGFFVPILDAKVERVTAEEADWYRERRNYYETELRRFDPLFGSIKRFNLKGNLERLVFEARLAPFGKDKYGWLGSILGPPNKLEIKQAPQDIIKFQASLQGGALFPKIGPHHVFAAVQDDAIPETDLRPANFLDLFRTLQTTPGYLGGYPKPGYLDILPKLGGEPDELGYTYSRLLKLWRLQFDDYSILSFDRNRLEESRAHFESMATEREAQIRLEIGDLRESKLVNWVNSLNYQRSWQTSITNVQLMNMLISQFGIESHAARSVAEDVLGVKFVCNLGGPYVVEKTESGRPIWTSESWPRFDRPSVPDDYMAPILTWFRGARIEGKQQQGQFVIYGWVDIERKKSQKSALAIPKFKVFQGFGKVEELPKAKKQDLPKKSKDDKAKDDK